MKFFKENSYDIVRLFVNQVGITIFALVLYAAVHVTESPYTDTLMTTVSVFSILFFVFLLYSVAWDYGSKDRVRVDSGRIKPCPAKGVLLSLCANSLNLLLALIMLVFSLIHMYKSTYFVDTAIFIINIILRFAESMYIGVVDSFLNADSAYYHVYFSAFYCIMPFIAVAATAIGYRLGYGNVHILRSISGKDNNKKGAK